MRAGFAESDITPKVPCPIGGYGDNVASEVLSRLYARALYVEGPKSSWALCSCDLIGLDREEVCLPVMDTLLAKGFDGGVILTSSHTHSGPHTRFQFDMHVKRRDDAYIERLKKTLVDIILLARNIAVEAEIGIGRAFAGENVNRRVNLEDGSHVYLPQHKDLYQFATGPTDEELGVVAFREAPTGLPIVTLVNYTAHALTIGNHKWVVTADYPGVLAGALGRMTGGATMFTQGSCGDVHPYGFETGPRRMRQMGETLAAKAYEVFTRLSYTGEATVAWQRADIDLPVQKRIYETNHDWAPRWRNLDVVRTDMTAARVGDVIFVGAPGELFVEPGLAVKKSSPSPFTYILYNANDYVSYIPTREAYEQGGYEPNATLIGPGAAETIAETGTQLAAELWGRRNGAR